MLYLLNHFQVSINQVLFPHPIHTYLNLEIQQVQIDNDQQLTNPVIKQRKQQRQLRYLQPPAYKDIHRMFLLFFAEGFANPEFNDEINITNFDRFQMLTWIRKSLLHNAQRFVF